VGSPEIMAAQMIRLAEIASVPRVRVQVLPAVAHPANASGFMIADEGALCEHVRGSFVYTDRQSVSSLTAIFDTLRSECWPVSESVALIREVGELWTGARAATQTPTAARASKQPRAATWSWFVTPPTATASRWQSVPMRGRRSRTPCNSRHHGDAQRPVTDDGDGVAPSAAAEDGALALLHVTQPRYRGSGGVRSRPDVAVSPDSSRAD